MNDIVVDLIVKPRSESHSTWQNQPGVIGDHLSTLKRKRTITQKILALQAAYYHDYERLIDSDTTKALTCFIEYTATTIPKIGAESDGAIVATWEKGQEIYSIRFKGRYYFDYAVTYLDRGELKRKWGKATLVTVFTSCPEAHHLVH